MMASYGEAEDKFFDARDEITSVSDLGSDCSEDRCSNPGFGNCVSDSIGYEFWTKNPESVHERRQRFLNWMGVSLDQNPDDGEESGDMLHDEIKMGIHRITENSGAVLRNSDLEHQVLSCQSSVSCRSKEATELLEDDVSDLNFMCKIKNLAEETEFVMDKVSENGIFSKSQETGLNQLVVVEESQRSPGSSSLDQQFLQREGKASKVVDMKKKMKRGWLRKLSVLAHIADGRAVASLKPSDFNSEVGARIQRVRVHLHGKRSKELSSLYTGQEFPAHEGAILTMKFSPDGQYLASAGEDGIVRVWKVTEDERPNKFDVQDTDPSCLYFSVNHVSKLAPLDMDKDRIDKMKRLKKSSDSACVIFPPKVFRILEKPLHEFHGHSGEVLALSWSKDGYLLSSSVDKTVRLWQVGQDQCLRVFSHNNYVTCIEFNPVDDNYFISGSIDGKVRIWEVHGCQVVDWTDIREIVTAVCYCPSGKGGIIGSMDGNCRFYDIIELYTVEGCDHVNYPTAQEETYQNVVDDFHLHASITWKRCFMLQRVFGCEGKKKSPCKRITSFQFSPSDPTKVMVTSAGSQVRILCGVNVICKFKGVRNPGSQAPASFTSDGKHIVSASDDSNVYVWNYISEDKSSHRAKNISSCENFLSHNASIALPWCGMKAMSGSPTSSTFLGDDLLGSILKTGKSKCDEDLHHRMPLSSPDCSYLNRGFFLVPLSKGSATWPEEKLPSPSPAAVSPTMCKSEYKFLKSACRNISSSHMWDLVIVTAGLDGRIRTYHNYGLPIPH